MSFFSTLKTALSLKEKLAVLALFADASASAVPIAWL